MGQNGISAACAGTYAGYSGKPCPQLPLCTPVSEIGKRGKSGGKGYSRFVDFDPSDIRDCRI